MENISKYKSYIFERLTAIATCLTFLYVTCILLCFLVCSAQLQHAGLESDPKASPSHSVLLPFSQPQPPGLSLSTSLQPPVLNIKPPALAVMSGSAGNLTRHNSAENQEVLLPPSSFTASKSQSMVNIVGIVLHAFMEHTLFHG